LTRKPGFLFAVGQLPQFTEKEDNTTFEAAQALPAPPLVVEGETAGNDVDYFRFAGKKGQVVVVDAQCARIGSGMDPTIRLTTAAGSRRFVASADDSPGLLTDARMVAELPEDTDYVVEISDSRYQGAGRPVYRLLIGPVPMADEVFPLGGCEGETLGLELRGGTLGERRIAAASLVRLPGTFLCAPRLSSAMLGLPTSGGPGLDVESLHQLVTRTLPELREPDDPSASPLRAVAPIVFNGRIDPPGDEDRFPYRIVVTPIVPGFDLQANEPQVSIPRGGTVALGVTAARKEYNGPIIVTAADPPAGVTVRPGIIAPFAGGEQTIAIPAVTLKLVRPAEPVLSTPAVQIKPGTTTEVKGKVERKGAFNEPVTVRLNGLPAGLKADAVIVAPGASDFIMKIIAEAKAAAGSATAQLVSAYQVGKKDYPTSPLVLPVKVLAAR